MLPRQDQPRGGGDGGWIDTASVLGARDERDSAKIVDERATRPSRANSRKV